MSQEPTREKTVVVHTAGTWTEAVVIRGLLESNGIASPAVTETDPFPMREPPEGVRGVEIVVLESQEARANEIIQDYLDDSEIQSSGEASEEPGSTDS